MIMSDVRSCTLVKTWTLKHVETRWNSANCNESNKSNKSRLALRWSSLAGASLSSWWPMALAALEHGFNKYRRVAGERIKRVFQTCFSGVVTSKPQWFKWFRWFRAVQDCGSTDFAFISVLAVIALWMFITQRILSLWKMRPSTLGFRF